MVIMPMTMAMSMIPRVAPALFNLKKKKKNDRLLRIPPEIKTKRGGKRRSKGPLQWRRRRVAMMGAQEGRRSKGVRKERLTSKTGPSCFALQKTQNHITAPKALAAMCCVRGTRGGNPKP